MAVTKKKSIIIYLFKILIKYCAFSLTLPTLIILKFFFRIRISIVKPDRIGHLAGEIDLYLRKKSLTDIDNGYTRIIITGRPCNKALINIFKNYVMLFSNHYLYLILVQSRRFKLINRYLLPLGLDTRAYQIYKLSNSPIKISLTDERKGYELLRKYFNLEKTDWWVCFHARDSSYLDESYKYHDYRNSNILNMYAAMEHVTSLGGYAVRFGSNVIDPINTQNSKFKNIRLF